MQVSAAQPSLPQSQLATSQRQAAPAFDLGAPPSPPRTDASPTETTPESEVVSLHSQGIEVPRQAPTSRPSEVFAEIWKDGAKIGNVYTDGTANLPTMDAGLAAGSYTSAPAPYARAQEISRMVGGEVRLVDLKALQVAQTRNQLRAAYGR